MSTSAFASGLRYDELDLVARKFEVADEQIHRDHLISRLLAGIASSRLAQSVTFIGGTALTRAWLPDLRLSEDIDLLLTRTAYESAGRRKVAERLEDVLERSVSRSHGRLLWSPRLSETRGPESARIGTDSGLRVRVQLLAPTGYLDWPTVDHDLEQ